ncbi:PDF receptor-like [Mytilus californianus]|uniref:PDF receptor-like n=1 Tax=Mytilus californianus TaxID=6549 RepID=UPI00224844CB|nr:PDF receptor-like [Mytilus californianus]XP_052097190.1 PDF receptor-like [Mytilus californianus]
MENLTHILIHDTVDCTSVMSPESNHNDASQYFCDPVHDGLLCWPATPPGRKIAQPCPPLQGFNDKMFVFRKCSLVGLWENFNNSLVVEKTNYESCILTEKPILQEYGKDYINDLQNVIRKSSILGISFILLSVIALCISFWLYKCKLPKYINAILRVKIHKHLFAAVILELIIKLIFQISIFLTISRSFLATVQKPVVCEILTAFHQYADISILMWIVIDLHFIYMTAKSGFLCISGYKAYVIAGWGLPVLPTLLWAITLILNHKVTCWNGHMHLASIWIVHVPKILCFVSMIVLISLSSWRHHQRVSKRLIQESKIINNLTTTGILLSLMLLTFLVVIIPTYLRLNNLKSKTIVQYLATIFTSSKGIFVAILCNYSNIKDFVKSEPANSDIEI